MARLRLRSPDQPLPVRWLLGLFESLASLRLAVVLIATAAVVLAAATFVEGQYGRAAVRFGVYGTWWFALLGGLLGVNILCAALIRIPWRRRQTGFVITHLGLLVLLFGCFLSWMGGIDASLPVFEGHSGWRAFEETQHFSLRVLPGAKDDVSGSENDSSDKTTIDVPFQSGPFNWQDFAELSWFPWQLARRDRGVLYDGDGIRLEVLDYYADSQDVPAPRITLVASPEGQRAAHGGLAAHPGVPLTLSVSSGGPHGMGRRYGLGERGGVPGGPRVAFWMTGNEAETKAFLDSKPTGPLGRDGRLVLHAGGERFEFLVEDLAKQKRVPLGDTGMELEYLGFEPRLLGVQLRIHKPEKQPQPLVLIADLPEFSQQDYRDEVFGSFWYDATTEREGAVPREKAFRDAGLPRVDILQGADEKLYYREWLSPNVRHIGPVPMDQARWTVFADTPNATELQLVDFMPLDRPGFKTMPKPFNSKMNVMAKKRQARVRLTVDGHAEEFWLKGSGERLLDAGLEPGARRVVAGDGRRVAITMPLDEIDIGFRVFLRKFNRKLDPGTDQASHYSSLVDLRRRDDEKHDEEPLQQDVSIALNAPVDFSDPATGRSYRLFQESFVGPWKLGTPQYNEFVADGDDRDEIFLSRLTVNYDPGRGLKYAGSLLIVLGIGVMYYMKAYFFKGRGTRGEGRGEKKAESGERKAED